MLYYGYFGAGNNVNMDWLVRQGCWAGQNQYPTEVRLTVNQFKKVHKIVIYATAPQQQVVAEAEIADIIEDDVLSVWRQTKNYSRLVYRVSLVLCYNIYMLLFSLKTIKP